MTDPLPSPPQIIISNTTSVTIHFNVEKFISKILKLKHIEKGSFEFNFISNETIMKLHKDYMKKNSATDIITFNLGKENAIIGDVYISVEEALQNAKTYSNSFEDEIKLLIVHGILHLLDYKDQNMKDKAIMEQEQDRLLSLADQS